MSPLPVFRAKADAKVRLFSELPKLLREKVVFLTIILFRPMKAFVQITYLPYYINMVEANHINRQAALILSPSHEKEENIQKA